MEDRTVFVASVESTELRSRLTVVDAMSPCSCGSDWSDVHCRARFISVGDSKLVATSLGLLRSIEVVWAEMLSADSNSWG